MRPCSRRSVRDNVLLGRPESPTSPEAELAEALDIAQADFVLRPAGRPRHHRRRGGHSASPAASDSASRSRARSPPSPRARARRPALGARRRHRGPRRGGAAPRARPPRQRSSSRTGRPRSCSPTASPCSRTAGSRRSARTPSCSPRASTTASSSRQPRGRAAPGAGGGRAVSVTGVEGEERDDFTEAESRADPSPVAAAARLAHPARCAAGGAHDARRGRQHRRAGGRARAHRVRHRPRAARAACDQDWLPLAGAVAVYLVTGVIGALLIAWYTVLTARISQAILIDLRKRVFLQTQRLSASSSTRATPRAASSRGRRATSTRSGSCWTPGSTSSCRACSTWASSRSRCSPSTRVARPRAVRLARAARGAHPLVPGAVADCTSATREPRRPV